MNNAIPAWLQIAWAIGGVTVAVGGILWIGLIFYPYLKLTRSVMLESLELGKKTADVLGELQKELAPMVTDAKELVREAKELWKERGRAERAIDAIASIPGKIDELVVKLEKKKVDDIISGL